MFFRRNNQQNLELACTCADFKDIVCAYYENTINEKILWDISLQILKGIENNLSHTEGCLTRPFYILTQLNFTSNKICSMVSFLYKVYSIINGIRLGAKTHCFEGIYIYTYNPCAFNYCYAQYISCHMIVSAFMELFAVYEFQSVKPFFKSTSVLNKDLKIRQIDDLS